MARKPNSAQPTTGSNPTGGHERVIAQLRSQGRRLLIPALLFIAIPALVGYFYGKFEQDWENMAILIAGVSAIILLCLLPLLFWLSTRYIITTRRVVVLSGLFTQVRQELLHSRSYDITVRRRPFQRMFGSGDLEINTGLDQPMVLKDIPDVELTQGVLQELMERGASVIAQRRQRGDAGANTGTNLDETKVL